SDWNSPANRTGSRRSTMAPQTFLDKMAKFAWAHPNIWKASALEARTLSDESMTITPVLATHLCEFKITLSSRSFRGAWSTLRRVLAIAPPGNTWPFVPLRPERESESWQCRKPTPPRDRRSRIVEDK